RSSRLSDQAILSTTPSPVHRASHSSPVASAPDGLTHNARSSGLSDQAILSTTPSPVHRASHSSPVASAPDGLTHNARSSGLFDQAILSTPPSPVHRASHSSPVASAPDDLSAGGPSPPSGRLFDGRSLHRVPLFPLVPGKNPSVRLAARH